MGLPRLMNGLPGNRSTTSQWAMSNFAALRVRGTLSAAGGHLKTSHATFPSSANGYRPAEDLHFKQVNADERGYRHVRCPCFHGELIVDTGSDNVVHGSTGSIISNIDTDITPAPSAEAALKVALGDGAIDRPTVGEDPQLGVFIDEFHPHVAWATRVNGTDTALNGRPLEAAWVCFIDAQNEKVFFPIK